MADAAPTREPITEQEKRRFLLLIRQGYLRNEAAPMVHERLTGTRFRGLCARDKEFDTKYQAALKEQTPNFHERIRTEYVRRAIEEKSDKLLHFLAVAVLPEFRALNDAKTRGRQESQTFDPARYFDLTRLSSEELTHFIAMLEKANPRFEEPTETRPPADQSGRVLELPRRAEGE